MEMIDGLILIHAAALSVWQCHLGEMMGWRDETPAENLEGARPVGVKQRMICRTISLR